MEHTLDHESRLSRIEALLEALNQRLDDAILTQLRDHGKRIRDLEDHISVMAETCARERGERPGQQDNGHRHHNCPLRSWRLHRCHCGPDVLRMPCA